MYEKAPEPRPGPAPSTAGPLPAMAGTGGPRRKTDAMRQKLIPGWADRTSVLVVLILALQAGFIWSYVGALHDPQPKHLPLGVVAPAAFFAPLEQQLAAKTDAVELVSVASEADARRQAGGADAPRRVRVRPGGAG